MGIRRITHPSLLLPRSKRLGPSPQNHVTNKNHGDPHYLLTLLCPIAGPSHCSHPRIMTSIAAIMRRISKCWWWNKATTVLVKGQYVKQWSSFAFPACLYLYSTWMKVEEKGINCCRVCISSQVVCFTGRKREKKVSHWVPTIATRTQRPSVPVINGPLTSLLFFLPPKVFFFQVSSKVPDSYHLFFVT